MIDEEYPDKDLEDVLEQQDKARAKTSHNLLKWLREGNGIFTIANPGSGTSALMRFIVRHEKTRKGLEAWAASKTFILCDFYFWTSGSDNT